MAPKISNTFEEILNSNIEGIQDMLKDERTFLRIKKIVLHDNIDLPTAFKRYGYTNEEITNFLKNAGLYKLIEAIRRDEETFFFRPSDK